jgi:hypothetical protein
MELAGATSVRAQVVPSEGACFDATLGVRRADGRRFVAELR